MFSLIEIGSLHLKSLIFDICTEFSFVIKPIAIDEIFAGVFSGPSFDFGLLLVALEFEEEIGSEDADDQKNTNDYAYCNTGRPPG